jgi:glucose/arabinose dehydrogenase
MTPVTCAACGTASLTPAQAADLPVERLRLPAGFSIEVYARVPGARSLAVGDRGTVFVGTMNAGRVYALRPAADGRTATPTVIASGLNTPNGVAFREGALYVAEIGRILRFDGIEDRLDLQGALVAVPGVDPCDGRGERGFLGAAPFASRGGDSARGRAQAPRPTSQSSARVTSAPMRS